MFQAFYRMLSVSALALSLGAVGCGGAPCDKAVDNQIRFSEAEGSAAEKKMAKDAKDKAGAVEGLIEVCGKLADRDPAFASRIQCQAGATNLASFKKCVIGPAQ